MEPATVDVDIEVADRVPVVGIAVGEDANQHRILTAGEARQLAVSLPAGLLAQLLDAGAGVAAALGE